MSGTAKHVSADRRDDGRPRDPLRALRHVVHFYEEDDFPLAALGDFIGKGLAAGSPCLAIATPPHLERLSECLEAGGLCWARARDRGQLVVVDAAAALSEISVDEQPDPRRFGEAIGGALERTAAGASERPILVLGEMVDLLWAQRRHEAAVHLERLWNDLARDRAVSLVCTMGLSRSPCAMDTACFLRICGEHSRVLPAKDRALEPRVAQRSLPETSLRLREQELWEFLENAAEGVQRVGPDGTVLWANKAQLDLLGYQPHEYIGHCMAEFHIDQAVVAKLFERLQRGETLYDEPAMLRCKGGSIKHVRIHSNAFWKDGRFIYTRCFIRDVTDRVRLDAELQRRMRELADSNQSKDEFLAMLAHELRNPLAPVQTAASVARLRLARGQPADHQLDLIERQAESMARLVDDLLDVSRITRGRIELRREPVELAAVVSRAVDSTQHLLEQRQHALHVRQGPGRVRVLADPVRIEQVVVNLLVNAAKYTPPQGSIWVDVESRADGVELRVRDSGIGIAPELLGRVFDLFQQADRSLDRAQGGLGIGLTIARRLVELHGGSIEARSEGKGRGAEFIVRLPRLPEQSDPPVRAPPPAALKLVPLRVLVVDDHADAAEVLAELLREGLGHDARTACDGPAALQVARDFRPHVVLLDIGLPGMDGYGVARHLRANACTARLVAVTGYGQERDRQNTKSAGFSDHLVKPVRLDVLRRILEDVQPL